ncbi:hypothetical protein BDR04DRAFT_791047 [Suillus decipiens]|nr:hypothetical protein BDR04DRAFT_791047 [Suillus decipiens]
MRLVSKLTCSMSTTMTTALLSKAHCSDLHIDVDVLIHNRPAFNFLPPGKYRQKRLSQPSLVTLYRDALSSHS